MRDLHVQSTLSTQEQYETVIDVENELGESDAYLKAMDTELRGPELNQRRDMSDRLMQSRSTYNLLVKEFNGLRHRIDLAFLTETGKQGERQRTLNDRLDNTTLLLQQSKASINHSETIGQDVMSELNSQKETLLGAHNRVKETKQFTSDAHTILRTMSSRAAMQKVCLYFTIVALLAVDVTVAYFLFIKPHT